MSKPELKKTEKISMEESLWKFADIVSTGSVLDKQLFDQFQHLLNKTFNINLSFIVDETIIHEVLSIEELPKEIQKDPFVIEMFKRKAVKKSN